MSILTTGPGGSRAYSAGGGRIYYFNNITTSPASVANAVPGRLKITFHNPGTQDIFVCPGTVQNLGSAPLPASGNLDQTLTASTAALGGTFRVYANGGTLVIEDNAATRAWNAFAASGTTNALTVIDSNV